MAELVLSFAKSETPPPQASQVLVPGQFWGLHGERVAWSEEVQKAHTALEGFFKYGNNDDLKRWLRTRWNGYTSISSPTPFNEDERTEQMVESLVNVPGRVTDLLKITTATNSHSIPHTEVRDLTNIVVKGFETTLDQRDAEGLAHTAVARRLADAWSIAAGKSELQGFVENVSAALACMHEWAVCGIDFGGAQSNKDLRTPRMYTMAMLLSTPLVVFMGRKFRTRHGKFTKERLASICAWFHQHLVQQKVPDAFVELEGDIMIRLRDYMQSMYDPKGEVSYDSIRTLSIGLLSTSGTTLNALKYYRKMPLTAHIAPRIQFQPGALPASTTLLLDSSQNASNGQSTSGSGPHPRKRALSQSISDDPVDAKRQRLEVPQADGSLQPPANDKSPIDDPMSGGDGDLVNLATMGDNLRERPSPADPVASGQIKVNISEQDCPEKSQGVDQVHDIPVTSGTHSGEDQEPPSMDAPVDDASATNDSSPDHHADKSTPPSDIVGGVPEPSTTADANDRSHGSNLPIAASNKGDSPVETASPTEAAPEPGDVSMLQLDDAVNGGQSNRATSQSQKGPADSQETPGLPADDEAKEKEVKDGTNAQKMKDETKQKDGKTGEQQVDDETDIASKGRGKRTRKPVLKDKAAASGSSSDKKRTRRKKKSGKKPGDDAAYGSGNGDGAGDDSGPDDPPTTVPELEPFEGGFGLLPDLAPRDEKLDARLFPGYSICDNSFWENRTAGKSFKFFGRSSEPLLPYVFGCDAHDDLRELEDLDLDEWRAEDDVERVMEITGTSDHDRQDKLIDALEVHAKRVLVVRACSINASDTFESLIRQRVGSMPMECQIPGFLDADGEELTGSDTIFTLHPQHFLDSRSSRSTRGINWLSGTTHDEYHWVSVIRGATVNFVEDWERGGKSVQNTGQDFPALQSNFEIGGIEGAYTGRHVDAAGFGTAVHVRTGLKIWWLLFPNMYDYPEKFRDPTKDPRTIKFKYWKVHAVRLRAGDLLVMPPGILHCVVTIEDSVSQGGHYLSEKLLYRTVRVNQELSAQKDPHTNAGHHSMLHMLVARHVLHMMLRYDIQLYFFAAQGQNRVEWSKVEDDWPKLPRLMRGDNAYFAHWLALLFVVRTVAPASADNDVERLHYASRQVELAVEKAVLFCKFWSMRTRTTGLHTMVENVMSAMMNQIPQLRTRLIDQPNFWVLGPDEEYPACILGPDEEYPACIKA